MHATIPDQLVIDLVRDDDEIVLLSHIRYHRELSVIIYGAGRITWITDNNHLRGRGDTLTQPTLVEPELPPVGDDRVFVPERVELRLAVLLDDDPLIADVHRNVPTDLL